MHSVVLLNRCYRVHAINKSHVFVCRHLTLADDVMVEFLADERKDSAKDSGESDDSVGEAEGLPLSSISSSPEMEDDTTKKNLVEWTEAAMPLKGVPEGPFCFLNVSITVWRTHILLTFLIFKRSCV